MSEPQANEVWKENKNSTGGFGVLMTPDQYKNFNEHIDKLLLETTRREEKVSNTLAELKQIEAVRTYASVVKDITTSIQTLSTISGSEQIVSQLIKSLGITNEYFHRNELNELKTEQGLESTKSLSLQTDQRTEEPTEETSVRLSIQ